MPSTAERCRTVALGGHREFCEDCGFERYQYHTCRNRHCPKCQTQQRNEWVQARIGELLPVPYFHHVFTLPHELHTLILSGGDTAHLRRHGGIHTALAHLGSTTSSAPPSPLPDRRRLPAPWVLYSKPPFAGPRKLPDYLGRYTHRLAISNDRLLSCDEGRVCFIWRDRRDGDKKKVARLPAEEFLNRFVKHILPDRFQRIRDYGLLANRGKHARLDRCRALLASPVESTGIPHDQ